MKQKLFAFLRVVFLSVPLAVTAGQYGDFSYTSFGTYIKIIKYAGPGGAVNIPAKIAGLPVKNIGMGVFFECTGLTAITIPSGVTDIEDDAFFGCTGLTAITVDGGNTTYSSEGGVLFNKGKTALIRCPEGKSGNFTIRNGVTDIEERAFYGCNGLTRVKIPNSMIDIWPGAFYGCTGLTSVTIPDSVDNIGDEAFEGCAGLTSVTIPASVTDIRNRTFFGCTGLTSVTIPGSVSTIGAGAFYGCTGLTGVMIPGSVTTIRNGAFGCTGLTSVTIPGSITTIEGGVFYGCTELTSVTIPGSVRTIGAGAFEACTGLTTITIPGSVTSISYGAFRDCKRLSGVFFMGNPPLCDEKIFIGTDLVTVFYKPGAMGWGAQYAGRPTALRSSARTVFFDAQGGSAVPGSKMVSFDGAYGNLPEPVRAGYAFVGWWTAPLEFGVLVTPEKIVAVIRSFTLYAAWAIAPTFAEALETDGWVWSTGGDADWLTQITVPRDDTDTASSGLIGANQESWLQTEATGPGTLRFYWKVDTWREDDGLFFFVDGTEKAHILGETDWQQANFKLSEGIHTLRWAYTRAPSADHRLDCGWLDQVRWATLPPPPLPESRLTEPSADMPALTTAGSFDGFFYGKGDFDDSRATAVLGTLSMKITKPEIGALTAKAVLQKSRLSFKAKTWTDNAAADGTFNAELTSRGGETLHLFVRQDRIWGTLEGGTIEGKLELDGARNRFVEKSDAAAQALLNQYLGYYTVALPLFSGVSLGEADAAPQGVGYLAATISKGGSAKIAGVLADGTRVSQSGKLVVFGEDGACLPFFVPLYSKKGWAGGLLWVEPDQGEVATDRELGWFIRWEKPGKGPDGFRELLDVCGGYYSSTPSLAAHYLFGAEAGDALFHHKDGTQTPAVVLDHVDVTTAGTRMTMAKGLKPKKNSLDGDVWYDYDAANPASATLMFTARTGLFRGKFKLFYDYKDAAGRYQHTAINVPYAGVLTPVRSAVFADDDLPVGLGHCLVPESDPALKTYRIKRSFPVWLEAE